MLDLTHDRIPAGLDDMEPGPVLAAWLASIDVSAISGYDRVVVLRAHRKMASHYEAQMYRDMTAVADALVAEEEIDPAYAAESAAAEVRAALTLTPRAADVEMAFACTLRDRLPQVFDMLMSGDLDVRRARVVETATSHLSDAVAAAVVERVAHEAASLTTGQLRARLAKLCMSVDPDDARRRYEAAVERRRVSTQVTPEGVVDLFLHDVEPHRAAMATRHLNRIARSLKRDGETRTMDQLRADVALDLLAGRGHAYRGRTAADRGVVEIRVDLDTLCHLTEHPGDLDGYGPVVADIARQPADLMPDAEWRFAVTDTETGRLLRSGATRRRPSAALRRHLESRDPTCVFPGCRHPSTDCDIDHITPWSEGGRTVPEGTAPVCRRDHVVRHAAGWKYVRLRDGRYRWTSPLGHVYFTGADPP